MTLNFRKLTLAAAVIAATASTVHAQTVIYSNLTSFSGSGYTNGGAATDPAVAANTITSMLADDITVTNGYAGAKITAFSFTVANFGTTAVSARPLVRFYDTTGTGGGPGTFLGGLNFNAISFTAQNVGTLNYAPTGGATIFTVPTTGSFWAGITFDNNSGATGATATTLNNLGVGLFLTNTAGSSTSNAFGTNSNGSFVVNNPAGTTFSTTPAGGGSFGWAFTTISASSAPEPSAVALSISGALLLVGGIVRRRRAQA